MTTDQPHDQPIRLEELLAELEALEQTENVNGWTTRELQEIWDVGRAKVLDLLSEAKTAGRLTVGRKRVERLDGAMSWRPCYRLRPAED